MSKSSFSFQIEPWSVVQENKEYSTPIFDLLKRRMILQADTDHAEGTFYVLDAPEWINVIALSKEGQIILVEQYRYGIEEPTLEIPGGMVDEGESALEAARRELLEETGYRSDTWSSLGSVSANPAIMTNFTHLYVAEDCVFEGAENPDTHERINVHLMPIADFFDLVNDGTVHHAIVLSAVARYLLKGEGLKREM
jgi:8-oxo-dGTP pyrophosphatase MutT (NUDIX family)